MAIHLGQAQGKQAKTPISQFLPRKGFTSQFPRCFLKSQLPINMHLSADCDPLLWDTDKSWHTLNYREAPKTKKATWTIKKVLETIKSLGQADWQGSSHT